MFLMLGLLFILFLLFFCFFFPAFYISELILSFLPYIVFFALIGLGLSIFFLKKKKIGVVVKAMPLFVLLFGLLFFLSSRQYNKFYTGEGFENKNLIETGVQNSENEGLNILYSNILYINDNYSGLQNIIKEKNPDMIFMVEFTDAHDDVLKDVLTDIYPYSARTSRSQKYFGNVVFSKYPITNLTHEVDQGAWRYSYFHANYNSENYYIYLIHTSSPVTYDYFEMRNNQFETLSKDFVEHQKNRTKNDKILMLGDFNVSPWSFYYQRLEESLVGLQNITNKFTILFTWGVKYLPFLQVHIDHIFVSDSVVVSNVEKIKIPGSDHNGFFIENMR